MHPYQMPSPLVWHKQTWDTTLATLIMCTIRYPQVYIVNRCHMFSTDGNSHSAKINVIIQKSSHGVMIPKKLRNNYKHHIIFHEISYLALLFLKIDPIILDYVSIQWTCTNRVALGGWFNFYFCPCLARWSCCARCPCLAHWSCSCLPGRCCYLSSVSPSFWRKSATNTTWQGSESSKKGCKSNNSCRSKVSIPKDCNEEKKIQIKVRSISRMEVTLMTIGNAFLYP